MKMLRTSPEREPETLSLARLDRKAYAWSAEKVTKAKAKQRERELLAARRRRAAKLPQAKDGSLAQRLGRLAVVMLEKQA